MEKTILNDLYDDENDNDLNKAKLSLNNENSLNNIEDDFNISTPIYYRSNGLEYEDLIFKNHNQPHNFSSSSLSNYNFSNLNQNPIAKTYVEENEYIHVYPNYTTDTHTLSLSESNHSYSSIKGVNFNTGNNGLPNSTRNTFPSNNTYLNYKEPDYNNFNNYTKNKYFSNTNFFYQANSFHLDQNINHLNQNSYTYNDYNNSK